MKKIAIGAASMTLLTALSFAGGLKTAFADETTPAPAGSTSTVQTTLKSEHENLPLQQNDTAIQAPGYKIFKNSKAKIGIVGSSVLSPEGKIINVKTIDKVKVGTDGIVTDKRSNIELMTSNATTGASIHYVMPQIQQADGNYSGWTQSLSTKATITHKNGTKVEAVSANYGGDEIGLGEYASTIPVGAQTANANGGSFRFGTNDNVVNATGNDPVKYLSALDRSYEIKPDGTATSVMSALSSNDKNSVNKYNNGGGLTQALVSIQYNFGKIEGGLQDGDKFDFTATSTLSANPAQ